MKLYEVRTKSLRGETDILFFIFVAVERRHHSKTQPPGCHVTPPRASQRHRGDCCRDLGWEGLPTCRDAAGWSLIERRKKEKGSHPDSQRRVDLEG